MKTRVYVMKDLSVKERAECLAECADIIKSGGIVGFPTETVYGLGGNALDAGVSRKIYKAKGRPSDNPLIIHICELSQLYDVAYDIPETALKLADEFWPGPLTIILKKKNIVPDATTGGLGTVAVRMPSHKDALEFIRASGVPIAAPSANSSGKPSPTLAGHVLQDLDGRIDAVIDGGSVDIGLESTIVDLSGEKPVLLRPGYITTGMLEKVIGEVDRDPTLDKGVDSGIRPKAPGMMYRHYAPKGEMVIVSGRMDRVADKINELAGMHNSDEVAVITTQENEKSYHGCRVVCMGRREDEESVARQLYVALRSMDEYNIKYIYVEDFGNAELGDAIMNRLIKAAGHKIISV